MLHPQVSGDKNEEQVLNAIEAYTEHRPEITSRAINLLFDIARIERCSQLLRALKVSPKPGGTGGLRAPVWRALDLAEPCAQSPCPSSTPPPHPQDTESHTSQTPTPSHSTPLALSQNHGPAQVPAPRPVCAQRAESEGLSLHNFNGTC